MRSIQKLVQLGVTGPPTAGAWKKRLLEPPKPHAIVLNDGRELNGKVSPDTTGLADIIGLVGTRPSGKMYVIQIASPAFLSLEVNEFGRESTQ